VLAMPKMEECPGRESCEAVRQGASRESREEVCVMRTLELTDDECDLLTRALGMATATAIKNDYQKLALSFLDLATSVHRSNPNWTPYQVDHEQGLNIARQRR
jgi:uncharacterized protein (DUF4213/DUF364 family)